MIFKMFASAVLAGAAAGVISGIFQVAFVQPVLLHAELYETGQIVHFKDGAIQSDWVDAGAFDAVRDGLSLLFTALIYTGFGLVLVAAMALAEERGHPITVRNGVIWGGAGFVAVQLAPAFGLPPEVPGVAAADLGARQIWWFATVGSAAVALWLLAFGKPGVSWAVAAALLLAPQIVGAPHPDVLYGPAPPEIGAQFAARSLGVGFVSWIILGVTASYLWQDRKAA